MNLREPFAATALASLEWGEHERAIDRVAASGRATPLGLAIWKAKYQNESRAYHDALRFARYAYLKRYRSDSDDFAAKMVLQAMHEWLDGACRACRGVGEMMVNERRVVCETCGGYKLHRYSDEERARMMQLSYALVKRSAHKMRWVLGLLGQEDKLTNSVMAAELDR